MKRMRKVKINVWSSNLPDGSKDEESLLSALNMLVGLQTQEISKGISGFQSFIRIREAFEKAEVSGYLELEEPEFLILHNLVEKDIPSQWGLNKDLSDAFMIFLNAKQE
jgi:hypothetical protein